MFKSFLSLALASLFTFLMASRTLGQSLRSEVFVGGLSSPVAFIQDPNDPTIQYVVQQRGRIRVIQNQQVLTTDFLNLTGQLSTGSEQGLLGLAFAPDYLTSGQVYVDYTDVNGNTNIARFTRLSQYPPTLDPNSRYQILVIGQPFANHNGGTLAFGPDGYLYIGMGDGGSGNDPGNRAQTIVNMLLGKMLRLDITRDDFPNDPTKNYGNPPTNPFVGITGDDEIWSFGVRNPWKWSFDDPTKLGTGALVIGDVGQDAWEEVDYEPALAGGRNYGWRVKEGYQFTGLGGGSPPFQDPIWNYDHSVGRSVTGGYVYRGTRLGANFFGRYFFGDEVLRKVFSLKLTIDPNTGESMNVLPVDVTEHTSALGGVGVVGNVSSFGVDSNGEIYIVNYTNGSILKIQPLNAVWMTDLTPDLAGAILGGIRETILSDDKVLLLYPVLNGPTIRSFQGILDVGLQTDVVTPTSFDLTLEARINQPVAGLLTVSFRNWNTGLLEDVATFNTSTTDQVFTINGVSATNYRRTADGRVEMRLRSYPGGPSLSRDYRTYYDQVKIIVH